MKVDLGFTGILFGTVILGGNSLWSDYCGVYIAFYGGGTSWGCRGFLWLFIVRNYEYIVVDTHFISLPFPSRKLVDLSWPINI